METALVQTIIRVGVPALLTIGDMFIALAKQHNMEEPSLEELKTQRSQLRELPDLVDYKAPDEAGDEPQE